MRLNKIETFIRDNKLDFTDTASSLNGHCTIISGYALYIGIENVEELIKKFNRTGLSYDASEELRRIFQYAQDNNYGEWWGGSWAKEQFKF